MPYRNVEGRAQTITIKRMDGGGFSLNVERRFDGKEYGYTEEHRTVIRAAGDVGPNVVRILNETYVTDEYYSEPAPEDEQPEE